MSTIKDDPCAGIILDFIAGGVPGNQSGETGGSYDAYFGHAKSVADLSVNTLARIYEFQRGMLAKDPRSTAIGRYQFLRKTLQGLQAECNLPDTELFTPELQDKLGLRLLTRRGYAEWQAGTIGDNEFAHRLSMEWASLPDPHNDGRSHYDGDSAGNHASTTLDAVYTMLKKAKSASTGAKGKPSRPPIPAPAEPTPPAHEKPSQAAIMNVQLGLRLSGDYDGAIDGRWGPQSIAALRAFQKRTA